ncbi:lipoprotein [Melittangium boletus DSM 14713]|uniref:Lipoprotein n=1 Tax=Melittangium boletus DSM 14713 TaxID=1294270 RepID=A0A250ILD8_9BACT|nr:lipoprotein [Melittangium boletus DSM 14713]
MMTRRIWLVVIAALFAWPTAAHACSCAKESTNLPTALRTARSGATAIYRARLISVDSRAFGGLASAEVLEVFKGQLKPGDRLELPSGGGGDCTIAFEAGREYLMYAHRENPAEVYFCSRTRLVTEGDSELVWLRTGKLPPVPVALQRESVSCEPCDHFSIGGRLIAAPGAAPGLWEWQPQAAAAMKAGKPFYTRSDPASTPTSFVMVGRSWDGKPFELTQTPHHSVDAACMQKVQLRWCKSLDVSTPAPNMYPRFQCVEPGEALPQCDESKSRKAAWMPLEVLSPEQCDWHSPDEPTCYLSATARPFGQRAPPSAILLCHPGPDGGRRYSCRVARTPMPTSPNP